MTDDTDHADEMPAFLQQYYLVFLRKGPIWSGEVTPESTQRQAAHLAYLQAQYDAGHFLVYGPTDDPTEDLRGVVIMKVDSLETARNIMSGDPHVKIGHLRVEIMPWWADSRVWRT